MAGNAQGRRLRTGRVSIPNQIYAITTVTRDRYPYFAEFTSAHSIVHILRQEELMGRAETLAYVVMPDHLHWLLRLRPGHDLSRVVRDVKAVSSRRFGCRVWQKGFHDHALRREDDVKDWARYIVANPLRAGLVECIGDYPHWDAIWL